jgi:hypothetical protein
MLKEPVTNVKPIGNALVKFVTDQCPISNKLLKSITDRCRIGNGLYSSLLIISYWRRMLVGCASKGDASYKYVYPVQIFGNGFYSPLPI